MPYTEKVAIGPFHLTLFSINVQTTHRNINNVNTYCQCICKYKSPGAFLLFSSLSKERNNIFIINFEMVKDCAVQNISIAGCKQQWGFTCP